jgi:hypothetical protein
VSDSANDIVTMVLEVSRVDDACKQPMRVRNVKLVSMRWIVVIQSFSLLAACLHFIFVCFRQVLYRVPEAAAFRAMPACTAPNNH